jgi:mono/diheme cytochrome c family protein
MIRNNVLKSILFIIPTALLLILSADNVLAHSWMAPKDAAKKQNPTPLNQVSVSKGKGIYANNCAYCHGDNVKGLSSETTGLQKNTPNLIQRLKTHTGGDFHWKIQNGKSEMPSFRGDLSEKEIWDVINFIRSLGD